MRTPVLCLLLAATVLVGPAYSQGLTGQITGTVTDASGSAIPGAKVTVVSNETATTREVEASAGGDFVIPLLLRGTYRISITAKGFKKYEQDNVAVSANERVTLPNLKLEVGEMTQTVTVSAEAARIQTESAERMGLIDSTQTENVPLKGRDYLGLVKLLPGVVDTQNRNAPGWNNFSSISINGNRTGTVNLTLDGVSSLDTGSMTGPYLAPSIDAVAEVKVLLTNYQAEYGRSSGGTINTVIKGGSQEFRGGAYYFVRNEAFNANEFFRNKAGLKKPLYRFNYPGYFLGGPVYIPGKFNTNKDKLFFFWSQEFLPRNYPTDLVQRTFPTALERDGNFSASRDANGAVITVNDPLAGKTPFAGNIIPSSRIDKNGQALMKILPLPNAVGVATSYNALIQAPVDQPRRDSILRIDWNISQNTRFYWRGINDYEAFKGDFNFVLASSSWGQLPMKYDIRSAGSVATLIHTFSPSLVNEFTFGINRAKQAVEPLTSEGLNRNVRSALGLSLPQFYPGANPLNLIPNANFGGVTNAGVLSIEARFPFFGTNNIWNYSDNVSWIKGKHNVKVGAYLEKTTRNAQRSSAFNGTFNFNRDVNNPYDTNYAYSNAMLGSVQTYQEANGHPHAHARYINFEWFAQDTWKVSRRFSIDAGVRFYFIQPTWSSNDKLAMFDPTLYKLASQPALIQPYKETASSARVGRDPSTGEILPAATIGTFSTTGTPFQGMSQFSERIMVTPPIKVAPRIGFAWDVFGTGKTAVRGGAGIFYDRFNDDQILQLVEMPPLLTTQTSYYTTIADLLRSPARLTPTGVFGIQRDYDPPSVYNWSFGVQQNIGFGTVLDVAYVGSVGRHLMQRRSLNAVPYGTRFKSTSIDPTTGSAYADNFLRPVQGYADIQYIELASTSNYHSMQTQINKRFSKGFQYGVSWTWSKSMNLVNGNGDAINPFLDYRMRNYGKGNFDRTHNFTLNYLYSLPKVSKKWNIGAFKYVLDNWDVAGVTTFTSGAPVGLGYSLVSGADIVGGSGAGVDSRVVLTGNPVLDKGQRTEYKHFNTSVVQAPTKADFGIGNAPKDPIRGPGINVFDMSVYKSIPLGADEKRRLQFRFEFYNFFNHASFQGLDASGRFDANGNQVSSTFGNYTSTLDARRVVLGAKFYF